MRNGTGFFALRTTYSKNSMGSKYKRRRLLGKYRLRAQGVRNPKESSSAGKALKNHMVMAPQNWLPRKIT